MIERVFFKDNLSFPKLELNLGPGLVVLSGASGAGKSVIFKSILSVFALSPACAKLAEISFANSLGSDIYEDESPNIIKMTNEKSQRFFINDCAISKKSLQELMASRVRFLNTKSLAELEGDSLLEALDALISSKEKGYKEDLKLFKESLLELRQIESELKELEDTEKEALQRADFLRFEVDKISRAKLKPGEYDELLATKTRISRSQKISEAAQKLQNIFSYQKSALEIYKLSDADPCNFEIAMQELQDLIENAMQSSEIDPNALMDRISTLSSLVKKYGSEEEALEFLAQRKQELEELDNLEFNKDQKQKQSAKLYKHCLKEAQKLNESRKKHLNELLALLNSFLSQLFMPHLELNLICQELESKLLLNLGSAALKNISSGELNRLRLALIATKAQLNKETGVLFLDEIDANLSGKEAASIAALLEKLSSSYQIFAISHLPWLAAKAHYHVLVQKSQDESSAKLVKGEERISELARMVSGELITPEALKLARSLLKPS